MAGLVVTSRELQNVCVIKKCGHLYALRFNNLERHLFPSSAKPLATHSTEVNVDHRSDNIEIDQLLSSLRMKMLQRRVPD